LESDLGCGLVSDFDSDLGSDFDSDLVSPLLLSELPSVLGEEPLLDDSELLPEAL
jgi:hypothetical protein